MDIVQLIIKQLGVDPDQAKGGLGLLLGLIKDKLPPDSFGKIADYIPNADELIKAAPDTSGGLMGALGGIASAIGGKAEGAGDLAGLAQGFSNLNLDSEMIPKFASTAIEYLQAKGGDSVANLVKDLLS